jgi:hypothetical protein
MYRMFALRARVKSAQCESILYGPGLLHVKVEVHVVGRPSRRNWLEAATLSVGNAKPSLDVYAKVLGLCG